MNRSFIDIINILGAILVAAVIIFAFYSLFIDKPFYEPSSYWDNSSGTTIGEGEESGSYESDKPIDKLYIKNISGRIETEGWNKDYIRLDYRKRGPGKAPEVKTDLAGSELTIAAVYPKSPGNFGSVDFFLKVPEDIEFLKANSVSGRIEISGLGENTEQRLSTTSGSITTDSSGDLDISSVSGSLSFNSSGDEIEASTTSGRINGALEKVHSSGKIDISSVSGSVALEVPSGLNAEVDLHSVSGSVSSELPVSVTETKRNTIRGVIGSGGPDVEISTVSGSIKITE